jgi:glucosamine-phosphate N-acetyltransferase
MFAVEDRAAGGKIVACGTLFLELKFIHTGGWCGHIEDVVVDKAERGRGLGRLIVSTLKNAAQRLGCYKVILDCADANVGFYEKCGFSRKEVCMARYAPV